MTHREWGRVWRPPENEDSDREYSPCDTPGSQSSSDLTFNFEGILNLDSTTTTTTSEGSSTGFGVAMRAGQRGELQLSSSSDNNGMTATQESGRYEAFGYQGAPAHHLQTDDVNSYSGATRSEEERRERNDHRDRGRPRTVTVSERDIASAIAHLPTADILRFLNDVTSYSSASTQAEVQRCRYKSMPQCTGQASTGCEGLCPEHYADLVRTGILKASRKLREKVIKALKKKKAQAAGIRLETKKTKPRATSERTKRRDSRRREQSRDARESERREKEKKRRTQSGGRREERREERRERTATRREDIIESSEDSNRLPGARARRGHGYCASPGCGVRLGARDEGQELCRECIGVLEANRKEKKARAKSVARKKAACSCCEHPPRPLPPPQRLAHSCSCSSPRAAAAPRCNCHSCEPQRLQFAPPACTTRTRHDRHLVYDGPQSSSDEDEPRSVVTRCKRPEKHRNLSDQDQLHEDGGSADADVENSDEQLLDEPNSFLVMCRSPEMRRNLSDSGFETTNIGGNNNSDDC